MANTLAASLRLNLQTFYFVGIRRLKIVKKPKIAKKPRFKSKSYLIQISCSSLGIKGRRLECKLNALHLLKYLTVHLKLKVVLARMFLSCNSLCYPKNKINLWIYSWMYS